MKKVFAFKTPVTLVFLLLTLLFSSCKKDSPADFLGEDVLAAPSELSVNNTAPSRAPAPVVFSKTINWNNRVDGFYNYTFATQDFTNVPYWGAPTRSSTVGGALKVTLLKNSLSEGGLISLIDIPDAAAYQVSFDMKFANNFDWSAGGKVGFGFLIGDGQTGGQSTADGSGGSARIMWSKNSAGRVYLMPYLYYRDQPGQWGNDFGKTFPASGSIQRETWYNVKIVVRSNTGSNTNGRIQMIINGTTLMDQNIRWTTNDLKRLVKSLCFETFRGGGETYWQSTTDGDIYFDNVTYNTL